MTDKGEKSPKKPDIANSEIPKSTAKQRFDAKRRFEKLLKSLPAELDELLSSPEFEDFGKTHLKELKRLRDVLEDRIYEIENGREYYIAIHEIKGRDLFFQRSEQFSYRGLGDVGGLNPSEKREADIYHPDKAHILYQLATANVSEQNRRLVRKALKEGFEFPFLPDTIHIDDIKRYLKGK